LDIAARHFNLYLHSNQSGVARGFFTMQDVEACNARMLQLLGRDDSFFKGICIAPELPDAPSNYRKPSPKFPLEMIRRDGLDPARCWMVGDRLSDLQCGIAAGMRIALVGSTEHSRTPEIADYIRLHNAPRFESLLEFVQAIIKIPL